MSQAVELIVGLGNPGEQYRSTRHNVGFWLIEKLAAAMRLDLRHELKFKGRAGRGTWRGMKLHLLAPDTYMNLSGASVQALSRFYKIAPGSILVVHDDLDLPVGAARLKLDGGHGGHNGIRHIIECLGTAKFNRIRVGIGHPGASGRVVSHVLKPPTRAELEAIEGVLDEVIANLWLVLEGQMQRAMNTLHLTGKSIREQ